MRALALLAPLVLSGCSLLVGFQESSSISLGPDGFEICRTTGGEEQCLAQPLGEDLGELGYALTCQGVDEVTCQDVAERAAADLDPGHDARWIVVRPDSYDVCWEGPNGLGCTPDITLPHDPSVTPAAS